MEILIVIRSMKYSLLKHKKYKSMRINNIIKIEMLKHGIVIFIDLLYTKYNYTSITRFDKY